MVTSTSAQSFKAKECSGACCFFLEICWHRIVTCSVTVCSVLVLLNTRMSLATIADGKTAAFMGRGEENCKISPPSPILDGPLLGGSVGAH